MKRTYWLKRIFFVAQNCNWVTTWIFASEVPSFLLFNKKSITYTWVGWYCDKGLSINNVAFRYLFTEPIPPLVASAQFNKSPLEETSFMAVWFMDGPQRFRGMKIFKKRLILPTNPTTHVPRSLDNFQDFLIA